MFIKATIKEINGHGDNKNWALFDISMVPNRVNIIPSMWSMKHKWGTITNQVTKYKTCLNLHDSKQELGENHYKTYGPVVTWMAIWLCLML